MPRAARRAAAFALLVALVAGFATARQDPKKDDPKKDEPRGGAAVEPKAPEPTADEVKALAERFRAEREEAVKAKFPAEALARADDLAKRAEAALKENNLRGATRYYRDARWQVPFLPNGLPPNVARVFGESRMRHADRVNAVGYSPDGKRLASASRDGTVRVWDLGNGRELVAYRGHAEGNDPLGEVNVLKVADLSFHPKEDVVASLGGSQVHLWDANSGKQLKVLVNLEKADKPLKALAFSPDGKALAVGGDDGLLRVFDVASGKDTFTSQPRSARIEAVAYSPNGKMVAVADTAGQVGVYVPGAANPMPMSTPVVDPGEAFGVGFTADSSAVFTCGRDGKARLTAGPKPDGTGAGNTATRLREFTGHTGSVNALAVAHPEGKHFVTGGDDRTVRVWDVASGKQLRSFQGHMTKVTAVVVRPDGRQVASASEDGAIRLWDLSASDDHRALTEATGPVWAVALSPDGKRLAAAGADKTIRIYDPESGKLELTLTGHTAPVTSLAYFPDGNRLASAGGDRVVRIWDVAEKKPVAELKGHELPVLGLALSPDGKLLVSGATDLTVRGWDPAAGKQLWSWTGKSRVCTVAVRKDAKVVAVGLADGNLVTLDVSAGTPKEVAPPLSAHVAGVAWAAFSPDGTKLATVGGDGAVRVFTVADGGAVTPLARFDGQPKPGSASGYYPLSAVAFSPDGRFVASAGADMVVRVWDVQTKAEVRGLRAHTEWATAVAFSPDGRLLASGGADNAVRVFELAPQESSGAAGHLLAVNAVAVSPDGRTVATAALDQTIKLWDLASGREVGTLIGKDDTPLAVTFLGNDAVALGTRRRSQDTGELHFWGTKSGRLVRTVPTGEVYAVAGLADGSKVGVWSARPLVGDQPYKNSTFEIYDAKGEVLAAVPDKGRNVRAASFSPDLAWVVAGDETGTLRIWDMEKKERIGADWPLFSAEFGDIGITPDKKHLIGIDKNGVVKVADVAKRETLASVTAHKGGVRGLLVSPKGDTFVTIGADREVKAWSLGNLQAVKEVRSWKLPVGVNGVAYTPDGKSVITANADGTAYVLELP